MSTFSSCGPPNDQAPFLKLHFLITSSFHPYLLSFLPFFKIQVTTSFNKGGPTVSRFSSLHSQFQRFRKLASMYGYQNYRILVVVVFPQTYLPVGLLDSHWLYLWKFCLMTRHFNFQTFLPHISSFLPFLFCFFTLLLSRRSKRKAHLGARKKKPISNCQRKICQISYSIFFNNKAWFKPALKN